MSFGQGPTAFLVPAVALAIVLSVAPPFRGQREGTRRKGRRHRTQTARPGIVVSCLSSCFYQSAALCLWLKEKALSRYRPVRMLPTICSHGRNGAHRGTCTG
jgi:hypothetical protein